MPGREMTAAGEGAVDIGNDTRAWDRRANRQSADVFFKVALDPR